MAAGLVLSGGLFAREASKSKSGPAEVSELSRRALAIAGAALVSSVLLLERAGFIVTATLLFVLVARAFESRRPVRDVLVGLALSTAVYFAFTRGLGLALPRGF